MPPGDTKKVRLVAEATSKAGLHVVSYGSYYRLMDSDDPKRRFEPVLDTALALGAPSIRIWAGRTGSRPSSRRYREQAGMELRLICDFAAEYNIDIALEKHRFTLTDTAISAVELIEAASRPNLSCYWQPNPELSAETNLREIDMLRPYLSNVHVFNWANDNTRLALSDGADDWRRYLDRIFQDGKQRHLLLEFVKNDSVRQFREDVTTLKCLLETNAIR